MVAVRVDGLVKAYPNMLAVGQVSFDVPDGHFVTLLGPSGCGKTTTLRCIAGLERPDHGTIRVGSTVVCGPGEFVPIHKRQIGMVFQSYAIWPHMTVGDNVGFPLRLRRVPKKDIQIGVERALGLVDLVNLRDRYPYQLSGGQQQRVALARALVYDPRVLLLDEPLSNLDAKLREQMRAELRAVQRRIGVTTIYVTHDQAEAMELSDSIVVMNAGRVEQIGSAVDIYQMPQTPFVRRFVGLINEIQGSVVGVENGLAQVQVPFGTLTASLISTEASALPTPATLWIRPEDVRVAAQFQSDAANVARARIDRVVYQGSWIEYSLRLGDQSIRAVIPSADVLAEGDSVLCQLPVERLRLSL